MAISQKELAAIKIGDRIKFKAATRYAYKEVWRKVTSIDYLKRPCVRYSGWSDFIVQPHEINEVERAI